MERNTHLLDIILSRFLEKMELFCQKILWHSGRVHFLCSIRGFPKFLWVMPSASVCCKKLRYTATLAYTFAGCSMMFISEGKQH